MLKTVFTKVVWVGRAASTVFGLALVLALMFGLATAAFGANGDFFKVGKSNTASKVSKLIKEGVGPALELQVDSGAPLKVNSDTEVANLRAATATKADSATSADSADNADKLDGQEASDIVEDAKPLAASVNADGLLARSNRTGISSLNLGGSTGLYKVTFPIDVSSCMPVATTGNQTGSTTITNAMIETSRGDIPQSVFVETTTTSGSGVDVPFAIAVIC